MSRAAGRLRLRDVRALRQLTTRVVLATAVAAVALAAAATPGLAQSNQAIDPSRFGLDQFTTGSSNMLAGGHPDVSTFFKIRTDPDYVKPNGTTGEFGYGMLKRVDVDLPAGLVGDPTNFPTCSLEQFSNVLNSCPPETQVGTVTATAHDLTIPPNRPIYNLERGPDDPIILGLQINFNILAFVRVRVHADGRITAVVDNISTAHPALSSDVTLWGIPADHNGSGAPRVPFITGPTECETIPTTTIRIFSYESRSDSGQHSLDTPPEDCASVPFEPAMTVTPTDARAGAPTGLDVGITLPQNDLPDGRATAHVRDVEVVLPEGMRVSPSAANGLGACSPGEFGYREDTPVRCPDVSKVGSVRVETPVLDEPMSGSVYLAKQNDNPFGSLLALYFDLNGAGQTVKLAGRVDPDPVTGQLRTTFVDNPQLPFERLELSLKSGPRAPLVNPPTCGTYQTETRFRAWTGKVVSASTPMRVDQGCRMIGFEPSFEAGSVTPIAGRWSDFTLTFGRGDHDEELRDITVNMPRGLLAAVGSVELCPDAAADAGTCGEGSRIGSVSSTAGAGSLPYHLPGRAYLTGPYKGAPYGLSVVVPAVAGPFDLGLVVVRAAVHVDRRTAQVRVVSEPIPRILQGIPTQVRSVNVTVDREKFMVNPTRCAEKRIDARIHSQPGTGRDVSSRFQVGACRALAFKPRLGMRLVGRRQRTTGKHPRLRAVVRQSGVGESAIRRARVVLPSALALDPDNAQALCEFEDGTKPDLENHCPKGSIVGRARARTPLLKRDLVGDVYFVKNVRVHKRTGNRIRTMPMIVVALRGEIAINLVGESNTSQNGRLVSTFAGVPDAPITRFNLNIAGGKNGILAVTGTRSGDINLCHQPNSHRGGTRWRGQNGKRANYPVRVKTPCGRKAKKRSAKTKRGNRRRAAKRGRR